MGAPYIYDISRLRVKGLRSKTCCSTHIIVDWLFHLMRLIVIANDQLLNYKYTDEAPLRGLQKSRNFAVELSRDTSLIFSRKMFCSLSN